MVVCGPEFFVQCSNFPEKIDHLGLEAARFRVVHTLRSTKSTTSSGDLHVASSLGAPTHPWCAVLTLSQVMRTLSQVMRGRRPPDCC